MRAGERIAIDVSFVSVQRDMFSSGLVEKIGPHAFTLWSAVKFHADYNTGRCWPSVRRLASMVGASPTTVVASLRALEQEHLLKIERLGRKNVYIARERLDIRLGRRVICTVILDYVPVALRARLARIQEGAATDLGSVPDAGIEIIPGPGFEWNAATGKLVSTVLSPALAPDPAERARLRRIRDEIVRSARIAA